LEKRGEAAAASLSQGAGPVSFAEMTCNLPQGATEAQEFAGTVPAEVLAKLMSGLADAGALDNGKRLLAWLLVPENWAKQPEKIQTMALRIYTRLVEVAAGQTIRLTGGADPTTHEEMRELEKQLMSRMQRDRGMNPPPKPN
jgi:hypothetical protein